MRVVGIIAEYNPFHNGHEYHIREAKAAAEADYAVVAMAGDFVQRGAPAVYGKALRTECALRSGADLVIEMPVFGALAPAADFAASGISLLSSAGVVDFISFGSESGNLEALNRLAEMADNETPEISALIKEGLRNGLSWPRARAEAYKVAGTAPANPNGLPDRAPANPDSIPDPLPAKPIGKPHRVPTEPNDILAVEYLRAIKRVNPDLRPVVIRRAGPGYHSEADDGRFASATAARQAILSRDTEALRRIVPEKCLNLYKSCKAAMRADDFSSLLNYRLLTSSLEDIKETSSMPDGIAARLCGERLEFKTVTELAAAVKSRQYTYTRVSRCLFNLLLGITKNDTGEFKNAGSAPWLRLLGFNRDAAPLLSALKKKAGAPIIARTADAGRLLADVVTPLWEKHLAASEIYRLAVWEKYGQAMKNEFTRPPVIV